MLSHQQFHISHRAILADSSLQNCFNAATLEGFWARNACLRSTHSISVGIQSGRRLGCSKPLYFVFNKPFRGGPTGAFRVIVLQHNPSALRLEAMNRWPDGLFQNILVEIKICVCIHYRKSVVQVLKQQSSPRPSHYCIHDALFFRCCFRLRFYNVQLMSCQTIEQFQQSIDDQDVSSQQFFWSAVDFAFKLSHHVISAKPL